ncbi:MAG: hypothetical protein R3Y53_01855 [Bacillota bacterium]
METEENVMNNETFEVVETENGSTSNVVVPLLIGSVLTLAGMAASKKLKTMWCNHRAKKNEEGTTQTEIVDGDCVEIVDEE